MQENDVAIIMKQVCEGLEYIHREQILHRDIKPENILFNHGVVKISDFGWAVYRGFGMRKTASGSPLYYPPEIVKGEEYDDKIDVWTIGMMTYECILGKIPFRIYTEMDLDRIVKYLLTLGFRRNHFPRVGRRHRHCQGLHPEDNVQERRRTHGN